MVIKKVVMLYTGFSNKVAYHSDIMPDFYVSHGDEEHCPPVGSYLMYSGHLEASGGLSLWLAAHELAVI